MFVIQIIGKQQTYSLLFSVEFLYTYLNNDDCSLRSVADLVIQATRRTEFEDGLRPGSPGEVLSDNPSISLAHWSHLCYNTSVAVCEVWENPI